MARLVRMRWPELEAEAVMELEERNRELADEFWAALPFTCVQDHGVVTGKIMYCWAPLASIVPIHYQEWHSKAPFGRVFFSQGTGNKVIINYGKATEDINAPVLGKIGSKDFAALEAIGPRVWESTYITKEIFEVHFEKAGA